jgi:site-specific DNA-methyltransferase (adenine-specific)
MSWNGDQLFASKKQDWRTPAYVFRYFNEIYSFGLDAAATPWSATCTNFITPKEDALSIDWSKAYPNVHAIWLNPPYGRGLGAWMGHCYEMASAGNQTIAALVMARTDTRWWHDYCMRAQTIYLIKGRLKFLDSVGVAANSAPAPSALVVWKNPPPMSVKNIQYSPQFISCKIERNS